jgi:hypothetical protein
MSVLRNPKRTHVHFGRLLGTTLAQVPALMCCCPVSVSVARLMEFLIAPGQGVAVTVKPGAHSGPEHVSLTVERAHV